MMSNQKFDGVMSLIGGFSIHLTLGTLYCFGNMSTYMTSYLRKHVHPNITYSDMVWIPTLATVGQVKLSHPDTNLPLKFTGDSSPNPFEF